jgi:hypothetical protein
MIYRALRISRNRGLLIFGLLFAAQSCYGQFSVKLGMVETPESFHPFYAYDESSKNATSILYNSLYMTDENYSISPQLAKYAISELNPVYLDSVKNIISVDITLRENIMFLYGYKALDNEVTANDVVATFELLNQNDYISYGARIKSIESISVRDRYTVQVIFKQNQATYGNFDFAILPYELIKSVVEDVSTANYKIENIVAFKQLFAHKNGLVEKDKLLGTHCYKISNFSNQGADIHFSNVAPRNFLENEIVVSDIFMRSYVSQAALFNALQSGERVDFYTDLPPNYLSQCDHNIVQVKKSGNAVYAENFKSSYVSAILFNFNGPAGSFTTQSRNRKKIASVLTTEVQEEIFKRAYYYDESYYYPRVDVKGPFLERVSDIEDARAPFGINIKDQELIFLYYDPETGAGSSVERIVNYTIEKIEKVLPDLSFVKVKVTSQSKYLEAVEGNKWDILYSEWSTNINRPDVTMWIDGNANNISGYVCQLHEASQFNELVLEISKGGYSRDNLNKLQRMLAKDAAAIFLWNREAIIAYNLNAENGKYRQLGMYKDPVIFTRSIKRWTKKYVPRP